MATKKQYVRGYEVHGVSPLPHYFEEIYGHIQGIQEIGPRGDANYFWYSKDRNGAAYYEVGEEAKSAKSTYEFLSKPINKQRYLSGIRDTLSETQNWIDVIGSLDLQRLDIQQLFDYNYRSWMLDAKVFSYYLISQPYRLELFETAVREELKKRVAGSKIDLYVAKLTASEKMTQTLEEELAWAELLIETKKTVSQLDPNLLEKKHPEIYQKILKHYEQFKTLVLGDGDWSFDPSKEVKRFIEDLALPTEKYEARVKEIKAFPAEILNSRRYLIKELYLEPETIEAINLLAEMSHVRYTVRTEGFIPLIYASIQIVDELAQRLGYDRDGDFSFLTFEELMKSQEIGGVHVPVAELRKRRGAHDEFMLRINEGKIEYLYGDAARDMFHKLVPVVDHSDTVELTGVAAEQGQIEDTVTVYRWGDDLAKAITSVTKHPILVAGQTRPAMMPLIRLAKGIITDEGGVTSHAAIVARELKIPAVINTHDATRVLKTGDKVLLDADSGVVRKIV